MGGFRGYGFVGAAVLAGVVMLAAREDRPGSDPGSRAHAAPVDEAQQKILGFQLRLRRKERVAREVLAGRLTLLEAAALFRALDHGPPEFHWDYFRTRWPGDTDEERHAHEVIDCVYLTACPGDHCQAAEVRDQLRVELAEHLRCGPLRLPDLDRTLGSLDEEPDE
jgi:hypothetical protein